MSPQVLTRWLQYVALFGLFTKNYGFTSCFLSSLFQTQGGFENQGRLQMTTEPNEGQLRDLESAGWFLTSEFLDGLLLGLSGEIVSL